MAWAGFGVTGKHNAVEFVANAADAGRESGSALLDGSGQIVRGLAGKVLDTDQPYVIRDANDKEAKFRWRDEVFRCDQRSALGLPLKSRGAMLGVLILVSGEVEAFDVEEMNLLASMAGNLAFGIQSIRETHKREMMEELLALENRAFQQFASFPTLSSLLHDLADSLAEKLNNYYCSILLLNENDKCLYHSASPGLDSEYIAAINGLATGENAHPCGRAAFLNERVTVKDSCSDPLWKEFCERLNSFDLRSCCVTPINTVDGRVLGTFAVYSTATGEPDLYQLQIIDRMTRIIGNVIERYRSDQALKESEERFALAMTGSQDGLWDWNLQTDEVYYSPRWKSMLGYAEDELAHTKATFLRLIHPDDIDVIRKYKNDAHDNYEIEFRMKHKQGHYVDILSRAIGLRTTATGEVVRLVGTHADVTERKLAAKRLRESESLFRTLYDDSPSMFLTLNETGTILSINKYGADHLGIPVDTLIGKSIQDITHVDDRDVIMQKLKTCITKTNKIQRCEIRKLHKYGDAIWVRVTMRSIGMEAGKRNVLVTCEDISEARILSDQLEYQAKHDALTGLINRVEFEKRLRRVLSAAADDVDHALCYLDLDQFKIINDTCGHLAGDELLRRIGDILNTVVRRRDTLARMGGDEFAVLLEHCPLEQAKRVAHELLLSVETLRFVWEGKRFTLGVSIGLVPMRAGSGSLTDILSAADSACYAAKDAGRNRVHVYYSDDAELSRRRGEMEWVSRINHALEEDRFCLAKQDIKCLQKKKNSQGGMHYELLLRMQDNAGRLIYPGAFLPAAERYNLSEKIDRWVVNRTLKWLAGDIRNLQELAVCSINLSGHSMGGAGFLEFLLQQFNQTRVPPEKICFEITETAAIANLGAAIQFIHALKEIGCLFALDDFGTGVSSFNYLKNLPVDYLKIDGSFIREIHQDPIDFAMVRSINEIGQVMGKQTIAEFVENDTILKVLRGMGVNYAQGFAIGKPIPIIL